MLLQKLSSFVGEPQADILNQQLYIDHRLKARNETIYFTVDLIHQAIRFKKRVTFQYYYYTPNKQKELKHNGKVYIFSPFALIWNDDSYYVIGYSDSHQKITKFRIDRIYGIKISEKFAARNRKALKCPTTFHRYFPCTKVRKVKSPFCVKMADDLCDRPIRRKRAGYTG